MSLKPFDLVNSVSGSVATPTARSSLTPPRPWLLAAYPDPIIEGGDFIGVTDGGLWNDPCVIKVGATYVMYLTSSTVTNYLPPIVPFRATSTDGISWTMSDTTPLLDADDTPFVSNETPNVIFFNGNYHMYYTGVYSDLTVPSHGIGHAISADGITWTNDASALLVATGTVTDWNGYLIAEPSAVVFDSKLYLYFTGIGERRVGGGLQYTPQTQSIGLAISTDGTTFGAQQQVLSASEDKYPPALKSDIPDNPNKVGYIGYTTPSAAVYDGKMHLMYAIAVFDGSSATRTYQQIAFNHSVSSDGITGWVEDSATMLYREDFYWSGGGDKGSVNAEILGPSLMFDDGKAKIWWTGHDDDIGFAAFIARGYTGKEHGVGYAEMPIADFLNIPTGTS